MSIPDFDVEPAVGPRFWMVLLGVGSAITGLLAVIGWPLPVVSGRGGPDRHAWAQTVRAVQDWFAYDGWRMSGASWFYGALAAAALAGIIVLRNAAWSGTRSLLVVAVPAAALLVLGPAAQWALGLPWSNYGAGSTGGIALGIIVTVIVGAAITWLRRAFRRSARSDDADVNPPPMGVR